MTQYHCILISSRAALLKWMCIQSPGDLIKMQIQISQIWGGAWVSAFLTRSQMIFDQQGSRYLLTPPPTSKNQLLPFRVSLLLASISLYGDCCLNHLFLHLTLNSLGTSLHPLAPKHITISTNYSRLNFTKQCSTQAPESNCLYLKPSTPIYHLCNFVQVS